jgi:predicted Zn-dependent protease
LPLALLVSIGLTLWTPAAVAQVALPEIGDSAGNVLSARDEALLGDAFLREVRAELPMVDDPETESYIASLGHRLAAEAGSQNQRYRFYVVALPSINAFAGPGGIVAINTGLIKASKSESELAAVIAHEIAHVAQRHIARSVQQADSYSIPALAGLLAALVLATQNAEAGQAAVAGVLAGSAQKRLDFTRRNELEADRLSIEMMHRAGFDPRAVPDFFETLQQSLRYYSEPPEFLSTHPVTVTRISDSRARAEQYEYKQFADSQAYRFVRAKVIAYTDTDAERALQEFEAKIAAGDTDRDAARYGKAMTLFRLKRWSEAVPILRELVESNPLRVAMKAALAEALWHAGERAAALALYKSALTIYPNDADLTRGYAEALLLSEQPERALRLLEAYRDDRGADAKGYRLLARAYGALGHEFDANTSLAEYYYIRGDLAAAINQLGIALRNRPGDFYRRSKAEARLAQLKEEQAARNRVENR